MTAPARVLRAIVMAVVMAASADRVTAQVSRSEALALVFPDAQISDERIFLTDAQRQSASRRAGETIESSLVTRYTAIRGGALLGRAYVDTHTVRTKRESVLVSLDASGAVKRVDVVAFLEPPEYRAPTAFTDQFTGRRLDDQLRLQRAIRPLAGATLTAGALTDAVRRVLAIDAVLGAGTAPSAGAAAR